MKNTLALLLIFSSTFSFAQNKEHPPVLKTDSTWSKEIIPFPIHFAPEIEFEGYEDAQFTPGWGKQDSPEFWSYIFAWNIQHNQPPKISELETNLQFYFDGLMTLVNKDKDFTVPSTNILFLEKKRVDGTSNFIGKAKVYDAFRSKKMISLNIWVDYHHCEAQDKYIIVFRFSPQEFGSEVWKTLKAVPLESNACSY